jgi:hypothetical protein
MNGDVISDSSPGRGWVGVHPVSWSVVKPDTALFGIPGAP